MELAEFVDCIRDRRLVRNGNSRDAYETMRMVFAIYNADQVFQEQQAARIANLSPQLAESVVAA
jgi:hypothetical protein